MSQPKSIRLSFPREEASVTATLDWENAPATCAGVLNALPCEGESHHGIYSGSECVYLLENTLRIEKENATSEVLKGQVAFTWMEAKSAYGVEKSFAEICWFYDRDAQPRMWEGPVKVNVFATINEPAAEFYEVCRRMRREGVKAIRFEIEA